jgi:hypothetical protein
VLILLEVCLHLLQRLAYADDESADVDRDCNPGPFEEAIKISLRAGAGLYYSGEADFFGISKSFSSPVESLYYWTPALDVCFDISDDADDDEWSPSDTSDPLQEGNQPDDSGFNPGNGTAVVGNPSNETGLYDCSTVAASPGGQPCGEVVMECLDTYHWSCRKGQEGIVPPGTFCAW